MKWVLRIILSIFLLVSVLNAKATYKSSFYEYSSPIDYAGVKPFGEFDFVSIPLTRVGNLLLVEGKIGNQTGFFILDTGAPYLVLNATYFRGILTANQRTTSDVNGTSSIVSTTYIDKLELRSLYFKDLEADLADLGAIENRRGLKILGLMGINLFLNLEMRFDIQNQSLELHRVDRDGLCKFPKLPCTEQFEIDFKLRNRVIVFEATIQDQPLRFSFDSAAEVTAISNDLSDELYNQVNVTKQIELIGAGGKSNTVLYGRLSGLIIGTEILGTNTVITDLHQMGSAYGVKIDGMIGYDLLKQGEIVINFKTNKIIFCPKKA